MKILEWLKEKLAIENNKKLYNNLLILLCMGIVLVIVSNFYNGIAYKSSYVEEKLESNNQISYTDNSNGDDDYYARMEEELSTILSKIAGAGEVSVMITYESGKELVTQKDKSVMDRVTDEKDTDGGTRVINESSMDDKTVMVNQENGSSKPLIVKEINPEIKGVIIVAEGAKNSKVKWKISQAVQTVLDIPAYRVTVLETNK